MIPRGDLLLDPGLAHVHLVLADPVLPIVLERWCAAGRRVWLPVSAVAQLAASHPAMTEPEGLARRAALLAQVQWLAALADEAAALEDPQPRLRQLEIARARLGADSIILTRDPALLVRCAQACIPENVLAGPSPASVPFIDLAAQHDRLRGVLERRIHAVLQHGHFIMGPEIAELEAALARYLGVKHAITVANGTDSLEIALRALGVGPGDEVITVPFTWISTAEVIGLVGARPVFVDIEPVGFNLDPTRLAAAITPRTKAIIPVGLFGQMPDIEAIAAIAAAHGIPVIEDGAQSFGATRHGRRSCATTLIGSTSFFPAKPLGCYGDGGALFTDDDALAVRLRAIRTHGGERRHHHPYLGRNARLDTLQAAVLLAKLETWDADVAARGRIGARYTRLLRGTVGVPEVLPGNTHVYAQYTVRVQDRAAVVQRLAEAKIPTAIYYPTCLHDQPVFAPLGYRRGDFPESERASAEVLSLPMHPDLSEAAQDMVCQRLQEAVASPPDAMALEKRRD